MFVRSIIRRYAANMLVNGFDRIGTTQGAFHSTPTAGGNFRTIVHPMATPIAFPTFHGISFQSGYFDVAKRISFVTQPLFTNNLALRCEAAVSMPGIPAKLIKLICIEEVVEEEIRRFLYYFGKDKPTVDANAFVNLLNQNLKTALIQTKGIYLSYVRFEYVQV